MNNTPNRTTSLKALAIMSLMVVAAFACATDPVNFSAAESVTAFQSGWTTQLNALAPLIVTIILTGAGFRLAFKWIKRGTKV